MELKIQYSTLLAFAAVFLASSSSAQTNGTEPGLTGRYWDCCKPSCGWKAKADFQNPVRSCNAQNQPLLDFNAGTGCNGGTAFACADQSPWAVNDTFSYGFAGVFIEKKKEQSESAWCCACYELHFNSGNLTGKTMVVQASNTDYDILDQNMFNLAVPGGNNSYGSCGTQYGVDQTIFGQARTGVNTIEDCDTLPQAQRDGCRWRFEWLQNEDSPTVDFKRVTCPLELTERTGCVRNDDTTFTTTGAASSVKSQSLFAIVSTIGLSISFSWLLL